MSYTSRTPRFVTRQLIVLQSDSAKAHELMIDLNENGAMIKSSRNLILGEEVTLEILDQTVRAKIVWADDGKIGLSFDGRISADKVSALNKTGENWVIY
jgi:hypothetical protein